MFKWFTADCLCVVNITYIRRRFEHKSDFVFRRCQFEVAHGWRSFSGVNFINIIRTNFLYKRRFSSYILALWKNLYEKRVRITLMKLTTGSRLEEICLRLLWSSLCESVGVCQPRESAASTKCKFSLILKLTFR